MGAGKILFGIGISLLFIIALSHTFFQFAVIGTGINNFYEQGISGFAIGKLQIGEEFKSKADPYSSLSLTLIAIEWLALLSFILLAMIKNRLSLKREILAIHINKHSDKSTTKTDLDYLYDTLKEKKHLKITTISKAFGIDKELAMNWCKTLEEGNLATINYPRMGEPEVELNE